MTPDQTRDRPPLTSRPLPPWLQYPGLGVVAISLILIAVGVPTSVAADVALGGLIAVVAVGVLAAWRYTPTEQLTEEGVWAPGIRGPVLVRWADVVRVCEDRNAIYVETATRSAVIWMATSLNRRQVYAWQDPAAVVRFIVDHVSKHAVLELQNWLPT